MTDQTPIAAEETLEHLSTGLSLRTRVRYLVVLLTAATVAVLTGAAVVD